MKKMFMPVLIQTAVVAAVLLYQTFVYNSVPEFSGLVIVASFVSIVIYGALMLIAKYADRKHNRALVTVLLGCEAFLLLQAVQSLIFTSNVESLVMNISQVLAAGYVGWVAAVNLRHKPDKEPI